MLKRFNINPLARGIAVYLNLASCIINFIIITHQYIKKNSHELCLTQPINLPTIDIQKYSLSF